MGINNSKGEWIYWLSHDDMYDKYRVEEDFKIINDNPSAKVVFSDWIKIDADGKVLSKCVYGNSTISRLSQLIENNCLHFCAIMFKKEIISEVGYFNEENRTMQDVEMVLKMNCKYPFFKNNYLGTYVREFPELLFKKFNDSLKKDMNFICEFMDSEYFYSKYYSHFSSKDENYKDLVVLANFYRYLGDRKSSEKLIKLAISSSDFTIIKKCLMLCCFFIKSFNSPKLILIRYKLKELLIKLRIF